MPKPTIKPRASAGPGRVAPELFTEAGAANVLCLLESVRSIVRSLLSRGYVLRDGQLVPPAHDGSAPSPQTIPTDLHKTA